jgi:hypothetical protein
MPKRHFSFNIEDCSRLNQRNAETARPQKNYCLIRQFDPPKIFRIAEFFDDFLSVDGRERRAGLR